MKHFFSNAFTFSGFLIFGIVALCISVDIALAADAPKYTPLVGIPGLTDKGTQSLPTYINSIYLLIITIGALFGVVKIAIAGVKYSMSEVVSDKSEAKNDIFNVLLGLSVLLIPFMVLNTINPNLTRLDVLHEAKKINLKSSLKGNSMIVSNGASGTSMTPVSGESSKTTQATGQSSCELIVGNIWDTSVSPAVCRSATRTDANKSNDSCSNSANKFYDPNSGICKSTLSSSGLNKDWCNDHGGVWKQFNDGFAPYYNCANPN